VSFGVAAWQPAVTRGGPDFESAGPPVGRRRCSRLLGCTAAS